MSVLPIPPSSVPAVARFAISENLYDAGQASDLFVAVTDWTARKFVACYSRRPICALKAGPQRRCPASRSSNLVQTILYNCNDLRQNVVDMLAGILAAARPRPRKRWTLRSQRVVVHNVEQAQAERQ